MDVRQRLLSQIKARGLAQEKERSRQQYAEIKTNLLRQIERNYQTDEDAESSSSAEDEDEEEEEDHFDGVDTSWKLSDTDAWAPRWRTSLTSPGDVRWLKQLKRKECLHYKPKSAKETICYCGRRGGEHEDDGVDGVARGQTGPWRRDTSIVQKETDTIGRISYEEDPIPSLFLRLDEKTSEEDLEYLTDKILKVTTNDLYLHFLDYEESPECMDVRLVCKLQEKILTGLKALTEKTQLLLTSQGLKTGVSKHLHTALSKLNKNHSTHHPITIACSSWGAVDCKDKFRETTMASGDHQVVRPGKRSGPDTLGKNLSPFFTHHLFVDDGTYTTVPKRLLKFVEKLDKTFQHVHGMNGQPSVLVLMNGADKTLDHVINALERRVPVIVVNGSGGVADEIAVACRSSKPKRRKTLDWNGNVSLKYTLPTPNLRSKPDHEDKIKKILSNFDLVTIFDPEPITLGLDMVIVWALLKAKHYNQLVKLLESFHFNNQGFAQPTFNLNLERPETCALNPHTYFLLEAMFDNSAAVVEAIMKGLNLKQHFTMDNIVQLYNRYDSLGPCKMFLKKAKEENSKLYGCHQSLTTLTDVRTALRSILGGSYPLKCTGRGCQCQCVAKPSNIQVVLTDPENFRSCLPPVQEMFLWALLTNKQRLALMLWKLCEDRIASALVGEVVLRKLAEKEENLDKEAELKSNAEEFEELAVGLLKKGFQFDEEDSHKLLLLKTRWWGGRSCLQLAIQFQSQRVISQQACMSLINKVWYGGIVPSKSALIKFLSMVLVLVPGLSLPLVKINNEIHGFSSDVITDDNSRCNKVFLFYRAPVVKYTLNLMMFISFLVLFSYVLLVDLQPDFTVPQGILCGWVATYLGEEIRQILIVRETSMKRKAMEYFNQFWNVLDVIMIFLFTVGMLLALAPVDPWYQVRHVLLNLDIFICAMRLLQMFVVKKTLGPMFTMIRRMISDTASFMTILLVFVLSYGVVSHSILYPRDTKGWRLLYDVPREAYWQIYGEFFLDDIPGSDACNQINSTSVLSSQSCSSKYIAEFLLAGYAIITHVLLLNILIAKFNYTFAKVQGEATKIWAWHRCQIIYEFYNRPWLPPPFNIIYFVYWLSSTLVRKIYHRCSKCCCKQRQRNRGLRRDDTSAFLLKEKGKSPGVGLGRVTNNSIQIVWDKQQLGKYSLYFIEYIEAPFSINPKITVRMCSTRSCVVRDLQPDTTCEFKMSASGEESNGLSSNRELLHTMTIKTLSNSESENLSRIEKDVVKGYILSSTSKDVFIQKTEELSHQLSDLAKSTGTAQQTSAGTLEQLSKGVELLRNGQLEVVNIIESCLRQQKSCIKERESTSEEQTEAKIHQLNEPPVTREEHSVKSEQTNMGHAVMVDCFQERLGRLEISVSCMKDNQEGLERSVSDMKNNQERTERSVNDMKDTQERLEKSVNDMKDTQERLERSVIDMKDSQERLIEYLQDLISNR